MTLNETPGEKDTSLGELRGQDNNNTIKSLLEAFLIAKGSVKDMKRYELITEILKIQFDDIEKYNIHYNYNDEFPVLVDENGNFYIEEPEYKTLRPSIITKNGKDEIVFKPGTGSKFGKEQKQLSNRLYIVAPKRKPGGKYAGSEEWRHYLTQWLENAIKDPDITQQEIDELRSLIDRAMISTDDD